MESLVSLSAKVGRGRSNGGSSNSDKILPLDPKSLPLLPRTLAEEEEEEATFSVEDIPQEYKKDKLAFWVLLQWIGLILIKLFLYVGKLAVVAAFLLGNMCRSVFKSIIYLFLVHRFDVGDRCEIDGVKLVVEEVNILSTVFLRHDNVRILYTNSLLQKRPVMRLSS